jgi:hypothetical protein
MTEVPRIMKQKFSAFIRRKPWGPADKLFQILYGGIHRPEIVSHFFQVKDTKIKRIILFQPRRRGGAELLAESVP